MRKTALFIKTKNLGDAVIMTAAISNVLPELTVDVLCFSDCSDVYSMVPRVRNVLTVNRGDKGLRSMVNHIKLIATLRKKHYDFVVQFSDDWRGALLCRLIRPIDSVAYLSPRRPPFWSNSFKRTISVDVNDHAVERDLRLVRAVSLLGRSCQPFRTNLLIPPMVVSCTGTKYKPYVVLQLASRWKFKQLEFGTTLDVAQGMVDRGFNVILTGSPADQSLNQSVADAVASPQVCVKCTESVQEFSAIVNEATAVVTIDSLALHVAQALNKPVVAIFGPTSDKVWGPRCGVYRLVKIGENFLCRPCGRDGCDGSKSSLCLQEISAKQILDALEQILHGGTLGRPRSLL